MHFAPMLATLDKGDWFWLLWVIAILFAGFILLPPSRSWGAWGVVFLLLGILGLAQFGWPWS